MKKQNSIDELQRLFDKGDSSHSYKFYFNGLSTFSAAIFIIGEMAGSGVLALPQAVARAGGWFGIALLVIFCVNSCYGGKCLAYCWEILEERYPEYKTRTRNPYATIGYRAIGYHGRIFVSICIQITLFGIGTVYLLLSSQIIQDLAAEIFPKLSFCFWLIIIALILMPFTWIGSPKDFRFVGIGATATTITSCILILTQLGLEETQNSIVVKNKTDTFKNFFLAFGTLLFAFGGASTFPTIQNDMENKKNFSKSVVIAFSVILCIYLPMALGGYLVFGDSVQSNVVLSLSKTHIVVAAEILLAVHIILALLIVINPVCQELEELLKVPPYFHWKRCALRIPLVLLMILIAEAIPSFGNILALIGGSTITCLTFVLPPYCYLKLCIQKNESWPERNIPRYIKVYLWILILIGIIGGCASTYSAIINILDPTSDIISCFKII